MPVLQQARGIRWDKPRCISQNKRIGCLNKNILRREPIIMASPLHSAQQKQPTPPFPPLYRSLEALREEIVLSVYKLTVSQTQLRPRRRPSAWSIQQVLQHLMLTYDLAAAAFEERLAKGRPSLRPVSLKERSVQRIVLNWGFFPSGRKAPAPTEPERISLPALPGGELALETAAHLAAFDLLAAKAEAAFGDVRAINHMVLGPMSVPQWRRFQVVHGRHHLKQIVRIRADHHL